MGGVPQGKPCSTGRCCFRAELCVSLNRTPQCCSVSAQCSLGSPGSSGVRNTGQCQFSLTELLSCGLASAEKGIALLSSFVTTEPFSDSSGVRWAMPSRLPGGGSEVTQKELVLLFLPFSEEARASGTQVHRAGQVSQAWRGKNQLPQFNLQSVLSLCTAPFPS